MSKIVEVSNMMNLIKSVFKNTKCFYHFLKRMFLDLECKLKEQNCRNFEFNEFDEICI